MIKFETGRCSCHEDDVHQRKGSQKIKGETVIDKPYERGADYCRLNIKLRLVCHFKFHYVFVLVALVCWFDVEVLKTQHSLSDMKLE